MADIAWMAISAIKAMPAIHAIPPLPSFEASVESLLYEELHLLVHVLANEDNLLHPVAVSLVPVLPQLGFSLEKPLQLILRHGGIPLSAVAQVKLLARLLKDVAYILLALEIADALSPDDVLRPQARHKRVKEGEVQWLASIVDISAYAILLRLAVIMVVLAVVAMTSRAMVVMLMLIFFIMFMVVMLIITFMFMVVMIVIIFFIMLMMVLMVVFLLLIFLFSTLNLAYPSG